MISPAPGPSFLSPKSSPSSPSESVFNYFLLICIICLLFLIDIFDAITVENGIVYVVDRSVAFEICVLKFFPVV